MVAEHALPIIHRLHRGEGLCILLVLSHDSALLSERSVGIGVVGYPSVY